MLRIAQVGPLWENIPPLLYGGTERVVSFLTEGLVEKGLDVTLFACGTSKTTAKLVSVYPTPLFRDNVPWTNIMYPLLNITEAFDRHADFDIIHVHLNKASDYLALPLAKHIAKKVVFTLHFPYPSSQGREDRHKVFQKYKDLQYVSISNSQRQGGEDLNWIGTVYNGIDLIPYSFHPTPKDYFFWLGKFNPDKGVHEAILAAKKANVKLILAGKIDHLENEDYVYYKEKVEPHIDNEQIVYVGEINDTQKNDYFGNAIAFLNPLQWNEPFGLTMAESMACGTPVISFTAGSAPELIKDNATGFLVTTIDEMAERMKEVSTIDREACRKRAETMFSAQAMTNGYLDIYSSLYL
jgi:glycosyltransferase involved in cell wall biosynthesis